MPFTDTTASGPDEDSLDWIMQRNSAAVPGLRHEIMQALRLRVDPTGDLNAAELVIGELLGNVVQHASGQARVSLRWHNAHPSITITELDAAPPHPVGPPEPRIPEARLPLDPMDEHGRGLYLARELSRDFSVRERTEGPVITAVLNLTRVARVPGVPRGPGVAGGTTKEPQQA